MLNEFRGPWPDGRRGAVALTFDCDVTYAYSPARPDPAGPRTGEQLFGKTPKRLQGYSRGLYGLHTALPRILDFLKRRDVRASFYVPGANVERWPDAFRAVLEQGHEVGAHGHEHENVSMYKDDPDGEAAVLDASLKAFRQHLDHTPTGYRSPAWDMNLHSAGLLKERGFTYDSSLFAGEAPHLLSDIYPDQPDLLEFPIDWCLDDAPYFMWFMPPHLMAQFHSPDDVFEIWRAELDGIVGEGGVFTLTCHPSVIGRHHRMQILERLVDHIEGRGDVWVAPLGEIADHVLRRFAAA
ncbi:polysaccharide deacetylase family protein [Minwuia sp.]|uniref:polysaccharide deacetylase family protein n=1 Tax=Minwuia sp. TaxID=2493630 RepID=UPI003A914C63